jgi:hypothetical protein
MRRYGTRTGAGIAWLVGDGAHIEGATDSVTRACRLTPRVRIRTADAASSWADSRPRPAGISQTWVDPESAQAGASC